MSRSYDTGSSQPRERNSQTSPSKAGWETTQDHLPGDNVSPRSKGEIPLTDKQKEDIRRNIEVAKERARTSPTFDVSSQPAHEHTRSPATAAMTSPSTNSALNSVPPELLSELRKIVREEFEQLHHAETKDDDITQPRSSGPRIRPTSPVRPFISIPSDASHPAPPKDSDLDSGTGAKCAASSPTTALPRDSPRHSTVRFSDETKPADPVAPRAEVSGRASTAKGDVELSAIDKRWGVLFDEQGAATKRMEQIVRGLANYIIEEFMPQASIVVTPEKMASLYSHHRLDKEVFHFAALFRSRSKDLNDALANFYQDLGCQYFLVPADHKSRPTVPGLTPAGFVHWLVTMIQAYPDEEAKRLDSIVSALPIEADSLLDGKPERLPKQISRHLLPEKPLRRPQRLVDEAFRDLQEDLDSSPSSRASRSKDGGKRGSVSNKAAPIIVTANSDRRSSAAAATATSRSNGSSSSRYVYESPSRDSSSRVEDPGNSGHDRDRDRERRHNSTSTTSGTRGGHDPDDKARRSSVPSAHKSTSSTSAGPSSRVPAATASSSSAPGRKNRSPQRKSYSQSVPAGIDHHHHKEPGADRARYAPDPSLLPGPGAGARSHVRNSIEFDASYRGGGGSERASLDGSAPVSKEEEDVVVVDGGRATSRRRSMFLPDTKHGPTWDDYLKSSVPPPKGGANTGLSKRDSLGYHFP